MDEEMRDQFPPNTPGKDISRVAEEFYAATKVEWGNIIEIKE